MCTLFHLIFIDLQNVRVISAAFCMCMWQMDAITMGSWASFSRWLIYEDNMQVYMICKDKISHFQLTVPIPEKKHVNDDAYRQNSWSNCVMDINVFECVYVCAHVCVCVCVCGVCMYVWMCVWYLMSSWQTHCRMWLSVKLVFRSTLRHKLERTNYLCTTKRVLHTKEYGHNEMCY